jgi:hypothetical protein
MAGLQSEWVTKVMRNIWGRVGTWENRVFEDLKAWTDVKDDFKFVRQAVTSMIDAKPINVRSHAASVASTGATDGLSSRSKATSDGKPLTPPGCIPFIGQTFRPTTFTILLLGFRCLSISAVPSQQTAGSD